MGSIAVIGAIVSAAGAAAGAASQVEASKAQKKALERQAIIAQQDAQREEAAFRRSTAKLAGEQRAQFLKGGVTITDGTPLSVMSETAELAEMEALAIRTGGLRSATARRTEAGSVSRAGTAGAVGTIAQGTGTLLGNLKK